MAGGWTGLQRLVKTKDGFATPNSRAVDGCQFQACPGFSPGFDLPNRGDGSGRADEEGCSTEQVERGSRNGRSLSATTLVSKSET
jgi:hypothetical protein